MALPQDESIRYCLVAKRKSQKGSPKAKKLRRAKPTKDLVTGAASRNLALDSLRGLAILLMIVDHAVWLFGDGLIQPFEVRFFTRLSMPLFCVITGFFLAKRKQLNWKRVFQLCVCALVLNVAINIVFYPGFQQMEILVSLLSCYLIYAVAGKWMVLLVGASLLYSLDPTANALAMPIFDYPLSVVAALVALGIALNNFGARTALLACLAVVPAFWLVPAPTVYVLWFAPLALGVVSIAVQKPNLNVPIVGWVGRHPLAIYTMHYLLLLLLFAATR